MTVEMQQPQHKTILIVDDDPMFLLMMRQFLEKEGYQVEQADNGTSALTSFHQHQPSCVLMDVSMPEMDGLEACKAIKKYCKEADVPVIMVTAQETDEAVDRCYDVGASDYIKKPIHWAVLRNRVHNLIEQSIANSRIKESEEKLNRAQAIAHMGSWELDLISGDLHWSDEIFRIFEIDPAHFAATYEAFLNRVHPEDRASVDKAYTTAITTGKAYDIDHRLLLDDGKIKWVHEQCENIVSEKGVALASMGTVQDITERKKAEERLQIISHLSSGKIGDEFFQLLVKSTAQALDTKIAFVAELLPNSNATAHTLAMWIDGELVDNVEYPLAGTPCEQIIHGQIQGFSQNLQQLFPSDLWLAEVEAESYVGIPMIDGNGQVIGHMGVIDSKPIVEEKEIINMMRIFTDRAVAELMRKRADVLLRKLSQAIESAGESILIADVNGMIEYVNPAFTKISGYSAEEVIGKTPRILNSGNQDKSFYTSMWKTITEGDVWHGKVIDKRKDGSFYPVMLTIAPIIDHDGLITHFVGSHADMTELENMEKQFQQAQKMEAIGTLVGGIAHDFNNMLSGITGNLYLAKKELCDNPSAMQKLTNIEQISFRASEMIKQLLSFARKESVEIKPLFFNPFIKETLNFLHASIPENINIQQNICSDPLQIKGDRTLLHQMIMNLINNARDAVEERSDPSITIQLEKFCADARFLRKKPYFKSVAYAHISVADNGCGIPSSQVEHLFEPFFTTKDQGKGTGLGLAMVFGAVKTHKGVVEVESAEGKGATFHVYIPLEKQQGSTTHLLLDDGTKGNGELVLIADDETLVRETMAEVLESMGYRVMQANDGNEAIEVFKAHQDDIDIAILDVVMPHCGGIELATHIREIAPNFPVIFLTGYDKKHVLSDRNQQVSNSILLTKPVPVNVLNHSVRELLS